MKSTKDFRPTGADEASKKTPKLDPIRKSGKERHSLYKSLDQEEDEDAELLALRKKESVLDYMDDGDDEQDSDEPDFEDQDIEFEQDEDWDEDNDEEESDPER